MFFNLWNLFRYPDETFELDVTRAETFRLGRGSEAWVRAALSAAGVPLGPFRSRTVPCRAAYYSDYPDDREWRNQWPECWVVEVEPKGPSPIWENVLSVEPTSLEELDQVDAGGDESQESLQRTVLLIADFQMDRTAVEAKTQALIESSPLPRTAFKSLKIRDYGPRVQQVRVRVSDLQLPAELVAVAQLVEGLRSAGGVINWHDRLTWPEEESKPLNPEIEAWKEQFASILKKDPSAS